MVDGRRAERENRYYRQRGWTLALAFLALLCLRAIAEAPLRWPLLGVVAAGMLLRAWAGRHLGPHGNGSRIEAPALARTGPYAFSRHPLYLANMTTGIGLVLFANIPADRAFLLILLLVIHHGIVARAEERELRDLHPGDYEDYARKTPRWFGLKPPEEGSPALENGSGIARDENRPRETPQTRNLLYTAGCVLLVWGAERLSRLWGA